MATTGCKYKSLNIEFLQLAKSVFDRSIILFPQVSVESTSAEEEKLKLDEADAKKKEKQAEEDKKVRDEVI